MIPREQILEKFQELQNPQRQEWGRGSFGPSGSPSSFISAKDVPYKQPGVVANFYGMTPENIFAPGQFLNKFQRDAVQKGIKTGGNVDILKDLRSNRNILGQNPEQARLLRQYLNTGEVPEGLSPQFAINAYDWAIRDRGRVQQTKSSFLNSPLGSLFKTAAMVGSAFVPVVGPALAIGVGGGLGAMSGGGLKGGLLGAAQGYMGGKLPAHYGSGLTGLRALGAGLASMPSNALGYLGNIGSNVGNVFTGGLQSLGGNLSNLGRSVFTSPFPALTTPQVGSTYYSTFGTPMMVPPAGMVAAPVASGLPQLGPMSTGAKIGNVLKDVAVVGGAGALGPTLDPYPAVPYGGQVKLPGVDDPVLINPYDYQDPQLTAAGGGTYGGGVMSLLNAPTYYTDQNPYVNPDPVSFSDFQRYFNQPNQPVNQFQYT